jgi:hypothetical protein
MSKAQLFSRFKKIYADGTILEGVVWQLPKPTFDRPHGLKYRLYFGLADGTCLVRYDNETGKGDHRHYGENEEDYRFISREQLIADFRADVERVRKEIKK